MAANGQGATPGRIPSLDGVRAVAVGLVFICHFGTDHGVADRLQAGNLGVRTFFVLSGYLITALLLRERAGPLGIRLGRFYLRRAFRILPPLYAGVGALLLLSHLGPARLTPAAALPAATFTSNYWSAGAGYALAHSWSLSVEEQFYLLWPPALLLLGRRRGALLLLAAVAASPAVRLAWYPDRGFGGAAFESNMDALAVGGLLAIFRPRLHRAGAYRRAVRSGRVALAALAAVAAVNPQTNHPAFMAVAGVGGLNLAVAFLLDHVVTRPDTPVGRALNGRPLACARALSYSLYIWQQPFSHLNRAEPVLALGGDWLAAATLPGALACTLAAAVASYYLVERPSLAARNWVERRLLQPAACGKRFERTASQR